MRIERLSTHRLIRALQVLTPLLVALLVAIPTWNFFSSRQKDTPALQAKNLPADLAIRTDGFSYSQTEGGRTIFSIKARTNLGSTDNKYTLDDVEVTVFGKVESDPIRTIRSQTCSYDESGGAIKCAGNVQVQLDEKTTVRTVELTYNPAERVIDSEHPTVIDQPGVVNGRADRFEYSMDNGLLKLDGNVRANTAEGAVLEAGSAVFYQSEHRATLENGVHLTTKTGWIRGTSGRAELEPNTLTPRKVVVDGDVRAHSDSYDLRSGWLETTMRSDGGAEIVKARGNVEIEKLGLESKEVLTGGEIDATFDAGGKIKLLEARENAHMTFGTDRKLTSTRIWTNGSSSVSTDLNSVLEVGEARIDGRNFTIEQHDVVLFVTDYPANLQSGGRQSSANRTEARFNSRTNELIELTQSGKFQFKDEQWKGNADRASFEEGGSVVVLTGLPIVSNSEMRLESAGRIRLNQREKSFVAEGGVKTVRNDAGNPLLVVAQEAEGTGDSIMYTRKVELWRGKAYIKADRLRANKENELVAEGNVTSSFESIRASSGKLEYKDRQRIAHYSDNVRAKKQDMAIQTADMTVKLSEKTNEVSEITARGAVVVHRGEQRGVGDEAVYVSASDQVSLVGKPARVEDKQRGVVQGTRLMMDTKGTKLSVESGPDGRAVARQNVKK